MLRRTGLALTGTVAAACLGITLFLPAYLNSETFYRAVTAAGLPDLERDVRRLSPTGADIGPVPIGSAAAPALSMDAVRLDYSPAGLARQRLDRVSITGLEISCGLEDGRFFIRGIDLAALAKRFQSAAAPPSSVPNSDTPPERPPFLPETLDIRHALIHFAWEKQVFRIPADLRVTTTPERLHTRITALLFDRAVTVDAEVDLGSGRCKWRILAPGLSLPAIVEAGGMRPGADISGTLEIAADGVFETRPFVMKTVAVRIDSNRYGVRIGPLTARKPDGRGPAALDIALPGGRQWDISLTSVSLDAPVPVTLSRFDARVSLNGDGLSGSGEVVVVFTPPEPADSAVKDGGMSVPAGFTFGISPSGAWRFRLSNQDRVDLAAVSSVQAGMARIHGAAPRFTISGEGRAEGGTVRCTGEAGPLQATAPDLDVRTASLGIDGEVRFDGPEAARATVSLRGGETTISAGKGIGRTVTRLPSVTLSGKAETSRGRGAHLDGRIDLTGGTVEAQGSRITVGGIRLSLPLAWPWPAHEGSGSCAFTSLRWDGRNLGALKGGLHPGPEGIRFDGRFFSGLLPGLALKITGDCPFRSPEAPSVLAWSGRYRPAAPLDMGRYAPDAEGMTADGTLTVEGRMSIGRSGADGHLKAALADGRIAVKDKDIRIDDIRLAVTFPELPALRSAPDQILDVGSLAMGKIRLEDAEIRFQIEPDGAVLVEKGRFKWCGGNVNAQSIRLTPDMAGVDTILYCDRLNLAALLDQLGAASAEGEGAVNGRIPVRLQKGKIHFDDGFLYSTPGDGGVIHVTGAQVLTAGIPKDTPQSAQIDLAVEALKSYSYTWAKLRIDSEGENLHLKIQFDGKPTAPLPFVYNEAFGGFVRVDARHPGSHFQGIRLDVNLGLPLDRILRYKELMEMIR